jgi:hypothetical protein
VLITELTPPIPIQEKCAIHVVWVDPEVVFPCPSRVSKQIDLHLLWFVIFRILLLNKERLICMCTCLEYIRMYVRLFLFIEKYHDMVVI